MAIKKSAAYGYTNVYISKRVCRSVTGWHMARPACSEILKSSVSNKGSVCMCVHVCVKKIKRLQWTETGQFKIVLLFPLSCE